MSGALLGVVAACFTAAASGGSGLTSVISRGDLSGSGTTLSVTSSASIAAGKAIAIIVRWSGTAGTISGTPTVTGETVNLNASTHTVTVDNDHCQILTITSAAGTGTKALSVTFTSSASASGAIFLEITGHLTSSSWLGAIQTASSSSSVAPSTTLTTTASGSGFIAAVMASGNPGTPTGTGIVQIAMADNWQYEDGQYRLNCGASGTNQTVAWPTAVSNWAISAIEVKSA